MNDANDLLADADEMIDQSRFLEAREVYRKVLASGYVSREAIVNLGVADNEERLAFWRSVVSRFPEVIEFRFAEMNQLILVNRSAHAVVLCTAILEKSHELREQFLLRHLRLRASVKCGRFENFADDFREVWSAGTKGKGFFMFRRGLLELVSGCTDQALIPILEELDREIDGGDAIARFLQAKVVELQFLEHAKACCKVPEG